MNETQDTSKELERELKELGHVQVKGSQLRRNMEISKCFVKDTCRC